MPKIDYEKYLVRKPLYEAFGGTKNRQSPTMTMMSDKQVSGCNHYIEPGWIYGIPEPNPSLHEHVHEFDEIVMHMGGDYKTPQVLGGKVEFYVGGQPITFNTSTAFYIPKGTPHGPVIWKKFQFPHLQMAIMCGTGSAGEAWGTSGIHEEKNIMPKKTRDFDYERYVVRSPVWEKGVDGALTYMSSLQVPGVNYHIEYGWITGQSASRIERISEMAHRDADEIILNLGSDPAKPEELGAEMQFSLGGQTLTFDTTSALLIPRGIKHRPLRYREFYKPHIFVAIMCGLATPK
jgi:hypothetical protein